jgi:hypothetical protein
LGEVTLDRPRAVVPVPELPVPRLDGPITLLCLPAGASCPRWLGPQPVTTPTSGPTTRRSESIAPRSEQTPPASKPTAPHSEQTAPASKPTAPRSEQAAPDSKPTAPRSEQTAPDSRQTVPQMGGVHAR